MLTGEQQNHRESGRIRYFGRSCLKKKTCHLMKHPPTSHPTRSSDSSAKSRDWVQLSGSSSDIAKLNKLSDRMEAND
uniref:Uncharacterized protein n=1 Tax=Kalanchoe fedtschenkoi TaxID=63787 RepID=A0A7N0TMD3_KALFE